MAKLAIFIDHDITIRHFVLSGVLSDLEKEHAVVYVLPDRHRRVTVDPKDLPVTRYRLLSVSTHRSYLHRRLYHATALKRARSSENKDFLMSFWREALGFRAFIASWVYSLPAFYSVYKSCILKRTGTNEALEQFLRDENPDCVIHPTVLEGLFVTDLVQWGKTHKKPVIFLMNSWDNPSTKAMTLGFPDILAVWGEQTKRHAVEHLGCPEEQIVCLGAAQFEVFRRPPDWSRSAFLQRLGLSENRKTLLYAGSSKGLNEIAHLQQLESAILKGQLPPWQIIFRPHPWRSRVEEEPDFEAQEWNFVTMDPQMKEYYRESRNGAKSIFLADYKHTHALLGAVDAVVSPISTILLEAALHGKPMLAYLPEEEIRENFFIRTMANMNFMQEFFDRMNCGPCLSNKEFIGACRKLMASANDPGIAEKIKRQTSYFVEDSGKAYGKQLLSLISQLSRHTAA